jgi:hypothetical protein
MSETKKAALIATAMILGIAFLVGDLHRIILQAVWPLVESFWFTYIAF